MNAVYIHIPFCTNICSYCDFCKFYKNEKWVHSYLEALEKEIKLNYKNEEITTLYIGGGSPSSLTLNELKKLFDILKIFNLKNAEITIEVNSSDLTKKKIEFLKDKVNRVSIGFQTNNSKYLKLLNRENNIDMILYLKKYFSNINIDLMYGFNGQTKEELKKDLDFILSLKPTHISTYALILEKHTKLYIDNYIKDDDNDADLYEFLNDYLKNYVHYETSNYALDGYQSKHNLVYWNNDNYYGFGLGASGYIVNVRYDNTKNLNKYLKGKFINSKHILDKNETMQNAFILGFRKIKGIVVNDFKKRYNVNPLSLKIVQKQLKQGLLVYKDGYLYIDKKYLYVSNDILTYYMEEIK